MGANVCDELNGKTRFFVKTAEHYFFSTSQAINYYQQWPAQEMNYVRLGH